MTCGGKAQVPGMEVVPGRKIRDVGPGVQGMGAWKRGEAAHRVWERGCKNAEWGEG